MSEFTSLRLAVLTDLHAFSESALKVGERKPSWLSVTGDQNSPKINPFAGVRAIISEDETIRADVVICGGDLGDKAHPDAQQYAWNEVHKLAQSLEAKLVIGTAGNHDVDSRHAYNSFDAKGQLQALIPRFPIDDERRWLEYWAKNFTTVEHSNVRFLILNSAAYHGGGRHQAEEYERGRVSARTTERILGDLKQQGPRVANVLLCHHHPFKNDVIQIADYSQMEDGDLLVNRLTAGGFGPWMVIHGHKHLPRLFHAPGGNMMPTIFSAGSFSARLYPEYQDLARNEFYIVDLQVPIEEGATTSLKGRIRAWQWSFGNGWVNPKVGVGLGPSAAFGARADLGELAASIGTHLKNSHQGKAVPWAEVTSHAPAVEFLIPEDLESVLKLLREKHEMRAFRDDHSGALVEIQVPQ